MINKENIIDNIDSKKLKKQSRLSIPAYLNFVIAYNEFINHKKKKFKKIKDDFMAF